MPLACTLFFGSGFAALIYELLWFRHLGFVFGNTVYAATTVLAAYMTGLALGAHLISKWVERVRRPVRLFGLLELGIGTYAVILAQLFVAVRLGYRWVSLHVTDSMPILTSIRFVLAFGLVLLPTMLMGATLPVLTRAFIRERADFGRKLGWLYGINTLGAVAGAVCAGFVLIPWLGLKGTNWSAVAVNFAVGCTAFLSGGISIGSRESSEPFVPGYRRRTVVFAAAGLAGMVALGFEVLWFRTLILVFGSTTYSFSAMLAVFLFGIGAGSFAFGRWVDRARQPIVVFALAEIGIGLCTVLAMRRFNAQPEFLLQFLVDHGFVWSSMVTAEFLIALKMLLAPAVLMGLAFTAAAKSIPDTLGSPSMAVARLYVFNTVGCVAGSIIAGFVLLPLIGLEKSILTLAAVAVVIGIVLCAEPGLPARWKVLMAGSGVVVLLCGAFFRPVWNHQLLATGPYFSAWTYVQNGEVILRQRLQSERLLLYKEGATATASVTKTEDEELYFSMDGKVEADTTRRGMVVQRMIGHLPMLFHPNPRRVMNLGLGAGVAFGALSCYPVDHLEVVEIEPATKEVARLWAPRNHDVMSKSNVIVTINDGRNHLLCTPQVYDVITSDPFEPVVSGASHLFTVEHFQQAKARLADDGIMCQWVPMYEMSKTDYLTILRSFVHVFPNSALFFTGLDTIMLGFKGDVHLDPSVVKRKFEIPEVRQSLADVGFTSPAMILGMFVADMSKGAGFVGPGPLNTDDRPVIEFSTPKNAIRYTVDRNQEILLENFTDVPDSILSGLDETERELVKKQHAALRLVLQANIRRADGKDQEAYQLLSEASGLASDNPVIRNELTAALLASALNALNTGQLETASYQFQIALQFNEKDFWSLFHLVVLSMRANNSGFAEQLLSRALAAYPDSPVMLALRGKYCFATGKWDEAVKDFGKALELAPEMPQILDDFSVVAAGMGYADKAQGAADKAAMLRKSPW